MRIYASIKWVGFYKPLTHTFDNGRTFAQWLIMRSNQIEAILEIGWL